MNILTKALVAGVLCLTLTSFGCVTKTVNPDGSISFTEIDYAKVQLVASSSIALWAASKKEGLTQADAKAVMIIIDLIDEYVADGSPIKVEEWSMEIRKELPPRYQAVAIVLVQIAQSELTRYGVQGKKFTLGSVGAQIMAAIKAGASMALAPYVDKRA